MAKDLGNKTLNLTGEERTTKIIIDITPNGSVSMELLRANVWKENGLVNRIESKQPIRKGHAYLTTINKFDALMADIISICDTIAEEEPEEQEETTEV